ncbi:MAG: hypothetical protein BIFFINMI_03571 [Phycisphaerae bacterium]|nr:hypothetical protein [Phycisphaerae bacterium]
MIEQTIATLLKTNDTLSSVSITLANVPSGDPPKITINGIAGGPLDYSNDGEVGIDRANLQINCIAQTATAANALKAAVRETLSGYSGTVSDGTVIGSIFIENEATMPEPTEAGRQKPNQLAILSVRINYFV